MSKSRISESTIRFTQTTMRAEMDTGWLFWHVHYSFDASHERMAIIMHDDKGLTQEVLDKLVSEPKYLQWSSWLCPIIGIPKSHKFWAPIREAYLASLTLRYRVAVRRKQHHPTYHSKTLDAAIAFLKEQA